MWDFILGVRSSDSMCTRSQALYLAMIQANSTVYSAFKYSSDLRAEFNSYCYCGIHFAPCRASTWIAFNRSRVSLLSTFLPSSSRSQEYELKWRAKPNWFKQLWIAEHPPFG